MVQQVDVPGVVNLGENVELECHYEISGNLYSIKWYLNDREFFRYQPEEETNIMIFQIPGVNVNDEFVLESETRGERKREKEKMYRRKQKGKEGDGGEGAIADRGAEGGKEWNGRGAGVQVM
ncbi:hypothetical protein E2C01_100572 [Portunus trituberculatus]|uniref:Ig-like domain-containing protein n=1 Tax=Portunus trituberculatus TaxID=210409 RepID=A0A5B7K797_PORTR|nr:hypothetical protein [Portunus trituberculatus]